MSWSSRVRIGRHGAAGQPAGAGSAIGKRTLVEQVQRKKPPGRNQGAVLEEGQLAGGCSTPGAPIQAIFGSMAGGASLAPVQEDEEEGGASAAPEGAPEGSEEPLDAAESGGAETEPAVDAGAAEADGVAAEATESDGPVQMQAEDAAAQPVIGYGDAGSEAIAGPSSSAGSTAATDALGVHLHTGSGLAESHDAAAVTIGGDIHFADVAVHPEKGPEPGLLRHELAHVAQQANDAGPLAGQAELEAEADAAEQSGLADGSFAVQRRAPASLIQAKGLLEWFSSLLGAGEAATAGAKGEWNPYDKQYQSARDDSQQVVVEDEAAKQERWRRTEVDKRSSERSRFGLVVSGERVKGDKEEALDAPAMAAAMADEVKQEASELEKEKAKRAKAIARCKTGDQRRGLQAEQARAEQRLAALRTAAQKLEAGQDQLDAQQLAELGKSFKIAVEPKHKTVDADLTTRTGERDLSEIWKGKASASSGETREKVDPKTGVATSTSKSSQTSVDLLAGEASRGRSESTETTNAEGKTTKSSDSTKRTASIGGSAATLSEERHEKRVTVDSEGGEHGKETTRTQEGALVAGESGTGISVGQGKAETTIDGDRQKTDSSKTSAALTDKGVSADTSRSQRHEDKKRWREVKVGGNTSFTIEVTPVEDSAPPQFNVVAKISIGGSLGAGAGKKERELEEGDESATGGASVNASVKLAAELVYTHVMDESALKQYLAEADKLSEGGESSKQPEFGVLTKLNLLAGGQACSADGAGAVLGDATAASSMPEGDSVELTLSGGGSIGSSVTGKMAGVGVGAEGSAEKSYTRTVKIERQPKDKVDVTVSFVDASKLAGALSASALGADTKLGGNKASSESNSVKLSLDSKAPDYQSLYEKIVNTYSPDGLRQLAASPEMKKHLVERTEEESSSSGHDFSAGVHGLGIKLGTSSEGSRRVTVDADGKIKQAGVEGSQTYDATIGKTDSKTPSYSRKTGAKGTLNEAGESEIDLYKQTTKKDLVKSVRDTAKALRDSVPANPKELASALKPKEALATALAQTPGERIKGIFAKTYSRLEGYRLGQADVDQLVSRAEDEEKWGACFEGWKARGLWDKLRTDLLQPKPRPELAATDPEGARKLALLEAVAWFMEQAGDDGLKCMNNALRNWGREWGGYNKEGKALGVKYDWPGELMKTKEEFDELRTAAGGFAGKINELVGKSGGAAEGRALAHAKTTALERIYGIVLTSQEVKDPRARTEMLGDIKRVKLQYQAALVDFEAAAQTDRMMSHGDRALFERGCTPAPQRPGTLEDTEKHKALAKLNGLSAVLYECKQKEQALFAAARLGKEPSLGKIEAARTRLREAGDLLEAWITKIEEMREAFQAAGIPRERWTVSAGPGAPRKKRLEPDIDTLCALWTKAGPVRVPTGSTLRSIAFSRFEYGAHLDVHEKQAHYWRQQGQKY